MIPPGSFLWTMSVQLLGSQTLPGLPWPAKNTGVPLWGGKERSDLGISMDFWVYIGCIWYMSYGISHQMAIEPLTWGEQSHCMPCSEEDNIPWYSMIFHDIPLELGGTPIVRSTQVLRLWKCWTWTQLPASWGANTSAEKPQMHPIRLDVGQCTSCTLHSIYIYT